MIEFFNWFLGIFKNLVMLVINLTLDGYSFGQMIIGVMILGAVITATISAVGVFATKAQRGGR